MGTDHRPLVMRLSDNFVLFYDPDFVLVKNCDAVIVAELAKGNQSPSL